MVVEYHRFEEERYMIECMNITKRDIGSHKNARLIVLNDLNRLNFTSLSSILHLFATLPRSGPFASHYS